MLSSLPLHLDPQADYAAQLVAATGGNGIVLCDNFVPCACSDLAWIAVGAAAEEVLNRESLIWLADVKWVGRLGINPRLFLDNTARIRMVAAKLNLVTPPPAGSLQPDAIKRYVFECIYKTVVAYASRDHVDKAYAAAASGLGLLGTFIKPSEAFQKQDDKDFEKGMVDIALNPQNKIAYGNILRGVAWCLHHQLKLGLGEVDMAFVREVLRVHPPNEWPSRRAAEDTILAGQKIHKGDVVYASIRATNLALGGTFTYPPRSEGKLVFGTGRHRCPVKTFSEKIILALVNGPGERPKGSSSTVNALIPELAW